MGSLIIAAGSVAYLETTAIIYTVEKHPVYGPALAPFWNQFDRLDVEGETSELTVLETLVGPLRQRNVGLIRDYDSFLNQSGLTLLPVHREVLREAASLRAAIPALRTPDAIHAATALAAKSEVFITNDPVFLKVPHLSVILLSSLAAS